MIMNDQSGTIPNDCERSRTFMNVISVRKGSNQGSRIRREKKSPASS